MKGKWTEFFAELTGRLVYFAIPLLIAITIAVVAEEAQAHRRHHRHHRHHHALRHHLPSVPAVKADVPQAIREYNWPEWEQNCVEEGMGAEWCHEVQVQEEAEPTPLFEVEFPPCTPQQEAEPWTITEPCEVQT